MAHDAVKRRDARRAYINDGMNLAVIAVTISVPESTVRRWKRDAAAAGDDWDRSRAANSLMGKGRDAVLIESVDQFVVHFKNAVDMITDAPDINATEKVRMMASLADSFAKVVAASGRVSPKISELGVALDTLQRFGDYISRHHPDITETFLTAVEEFGAGLSEVYK